MTNVAKKQAYRLFTPSSLFCDVVGALWREGAAVRFELLVQSTLVGTEREEGVQTRLGESQGVCLGISGLVNSDRKSLVPQSWQLRVLIWAVGDRSPGFVGQWRWPVLLGPSLRGSGFFGPPAG